MNTKDLLNKLLKDGAAALTKEERAALEAFEEIDSDKLANDRAAKVRREMEAKLEAEKKRVADTEAKLAELEAAKAKEDEGKLSDLQKLQKQLDSYGDILKAERKAREDAEKRSLQLMRNGKIQSIADRIKTIDGVDRGLVLQALEARLADVDLDDAEIVTMKIKEFSDANKALIRADGASGSGTHPGAGTGGSGFSGDRPDVKSVLDLALRGNVADAEAAVKSANQAALAGAYSTK